MVQTGKFVQTLEQGKHLEFCDELMGGGKSPMAFLTLGAQVTVGKDKQYVNSFKERSKQSPRLGRSKLSGSSVDHWSSGG